MKTLTRIVCVLLCLGTLRPMFGQPKPEYTRDELLTEQRIMKADIDDANFYVDRGIKAVGSNLPEVAKVCVLRSTGRIAKVEEMMKGHPERIERMAFVMFHSQESVRAELRKSYNKLRDSFSAVEDSMYALRSDMLRKGIFGEELKQQVAVLDAASKLLTEIKDKDPALAEKIRAEIESINQALASNDSATAEQKIKELDAMLGAAGYGDRVKQQQDKLDTMAAATGTGGAAGAGSQVENLPDGSTVATTSKSVTLPDGRKQDTVEKTMKRPDGTSQVVRTTTITNPDGSKDVTETVEEHDKDGNVISTKTSQYHLGADGTKVNKGSVTDDGERVTITDPSGKTTTLPKSFFHGNEGTAYNTVYVGGEGQKLTGEQEVKISLKRDASGAITADEHSGRERQWDFAIAEVPGARKFEGDGMSTRLVFQDNKRKTDFKILGWSIKNPQGQEIGHFGAQNEVNFKFTANGAYTIAVNGETDWGSKFNVSVVLTVAL